MVDFVNNERSLMNYAIFCELCNWMRFEVDCAKSHHRIISEGLYIVFSGTTQFILLIFVTPATPTCTNRPLLMFSNSDLEAWWNIPRNHTKVRE